MRMIFIVPVFFLVLNGFSQSQNSSVLEKTIDLRNNIQQKFDEGTRELVPALCHEGLKYSKQLTTDTLSCWFYQFLGDAYDGIHNDSAAHFYRLALSGFYRPSFNKKLYLNQSLLYCFSNNQNSDSVLFYIKELELLTDTFADTRKEKLQALSTIATGYNSIGKYDKAINTYRLIIGKSIQIKDSLTASMSLINAGVMYNEMGNDTMAVYYTLQSLPYSTGNVDHQLMALGNLVDYYGNLHMNDSSRIYMERTRAVARQSNSFETLYYLDIKMAGLLFNEKKYSEAEKLLKKLLVYYRKRDDGLGLINTLLIYAGVDTALKKFREAESLLVELDTVTSKFNVKAYRAENIAMLAKVSFALGKYKEAYLYQQELMQINDSLKTDRLSKDLAELQTQYQTSKKEEQINLLQQETTIRRLELAAEKKNKLLLGVILVIMLVAFAIILYLRNSRSKAKLQHLKTTLEMKALRSQMNPHFIFNSLNSIQKYIWENKQEDASEYLTRFARLIRLVLENSQYSSVSLSEELKALQLYIEMEHRRTNQTFEYNIKVAEDVDPDRTGIPPLLLQPYVENAIWHGLSHKDEKGKLLINITQSDGSLLCEIDDNGIGRAHSATIKSSLSDKKSLGMNISNQRVSWLHRDTGLQASVQITDKLFNDHALGTTVLITLPLISRS